MAEVKNSQDSAGAARAARSVSPTALPVMVAAARHSRRARSTRIATAGVSLIAAARPLRAPRQRERSGTRNRSTATSAMRMALTCAYSMVLGKGSRAMTPMSASHGARLRAIRGATASRLRTA